MIRLLSSLLLFLALSVNAQVEPSAGSTRSTPTPHGDTKMGADAATSGTNVEDTGTQAQEDESVEDIETSPHSKDELEKDQNEINRRLIRS